MSTDSFMKDFNFDDESIELFIDAMDKCKRVDIQSNHEFKDAHGKEEITQLVSRALEKCEYCHKSDNKCGSIDNMGEYIVNGGYNDCFINLDTNELVLSGDDWGTSKINYCPMCGRKLDE